MKTEFACLGVAALLAAGLAGSVQAQAPGVRLTAVMTGAKEKPAPADPKATGTATVTIQGAQVCYELAVKDLAQPTVVHIHKGGPDEAGPPVLPLATPDATGHSKGCATVVAAVASDLAANPGAYYVNVHSAQFKAGAIRGQLGR